jgi:hypothetical protein
VPILFCDRRKSFRTNLMVHFRTKIEYFFLVN